MGTDLHKPSVTLNKGIQVKGKRIGLQARDEGFRKKKRWIKVSLFREGVSDKKRLARANE